MTSLVAFFLLGQLPPTPSPEYPPAEGGLRDRYASPALSPAPPGITRAVFEFRLMDGGLYDCMAPGSCPAAKTAAPFETISTNALADGVWCFHGRYENDAGSSAFSPERCFREDKTPPPTPVVVDAGLVNGLAVLDYSGTEDVGLEPSLVERFCARAIEVNTADSYGPYCTTGPWGRGRTDDGGAFFDFELLLPLPPGTWRAGVQAVDHAGYVSGVSGGPTFTILEQGPAPPPPFWRATDGGVDPDDSWTSDVYFLRVVYPGVPGQQGLIIQKRDEDAGWDSVTALLSLNGSTSAFQRTSGTVRKQMRYAVVHGDGGASPWSLPLSGRLDTVAPAPLRDCVVLVAPGSNRVDVTFAGGLDALSQTSFEALFSSSDAGQPSAFSIDAGAASVVLPDGAWALTLVARDEAMNAVTLACSPFSTPGPVADAGPPPDAGPDEDAGTTEDAGSEEDGGASEDAGAPQDAGARPAADAGEAPAALELQVGCGCTGLLELAPWLCLLGGLRRLRFERPRRRSGRAQR